MGEGEAGPWGVSVHLCPWPGRVPEWATQKTGDPGYREHTSGYRWGGREGSMGWGTGGTNYWV